MKIKPLPGYVVIDPINEEVKSTSGLVMAVPQKDRPVKGTVVSVGEPTATEGTKIKEGDVVAYRKWGGDEVMVGEKEYRVVKFSDVIAIYVTEIS